MPNVQNRTFSGIVTIGSSPTNIGSEQGLLLGCFLTVKSDADNGVQILSEDQTEGDYLEVGKTKFYPAYNLSKIRAVRDGSSDVELSYYAF